MVKHLHITAKVLKLLMLGCVLFVIWGSIWLQSSVHSLNFAKPWILSSVNQPNAPYTIGFDKLTIDWRHVTELGKLRIANITFTNKEGQVFATFPEIAASIDFVNMFTGRTLLNSVYLNNANVMLTRKTDKTFFIGIEGADTTISFGELAGTFATSKQEEATSKIRLPFKHLRMDNARLLFHDEILGKDILGEPVKFHIDRRRGNYNAKLVMPYTYGDDGKGSLSIDIKPDPAENDYLLETVLAQFPAEFVCSMAPCPERTELKGKISGAMRIGMMADGTITQGLAKLGTNKMQITAPDFFPKPLNLTNSEITLTHDAKTKTTELVESKLGLDDTTANATVKAVQKEDGWYVDAVGKTISPMEVTALYKYWPLKMAPDTRTWITSKLKAGIAESGTAHLMLTPEDFESDFISDKALVADVVTKDVSIDYLPGFPILHHVNGQVHFTGRTVKIEGQNGALLDGTQVTKANLWCPDLINPKIPMEADIQATAPVGDAIQFLNMKYFTFDDALTLNAKTASGTGVVAMKLKFDAFSGTVSKDPNELHFESVDYDIAATISNFAQSGVAGGYKVQNLNGELKASTKGLGFNGSLALGASGLSDVALSQLDGKPLEVTVKTRAQQPGKPGNDFFLSYKSGAIPDIILKGKRLDGTVSYDSKEHSLLSDFPSMRLNVDIDELYMTPEMPLTNVTAIMNCGQRCEVLKARARTGKGQVTADIQNDNMRRQLVVTASDAGAFLNALGITDRMTRGKLELRGKYNDAKYPAPFDGKLLINDYTLKNSQILGRIFSIGSLTGLSNLLTGSGIAFDKLTANIAANKGVITVTEGRTNGTAMGMTVGGTVDTTTTRLALKGVVVPAYALNSMVGKIPVIGGFLTGGDGEGLIAFNYSVKGTYDEPDVMVNPLSGLTPGFLRGIFGIFDGPADTSKKDDKNQ